MQPLMITRVGAFGDFVLNSSVFPYLQTIHSPIHLEVNMKGLELFLNDPRFDYVSVFDVDSLDEAQRYSGCMERWEKLKKDCEREGKRFINFFSSIENSCILHEANIDVGMSKEDRALKYGGNFYEKTFEIAEVKMPSGWFHENTLHFHDHEIALVQRWRERNNDFFIMMLALGGSSRQKVFIWMKDFCKKLIDEYPKLKIYIMGGSELKDDVWEYERTISYVNGSCPQTISFRQASLMTRYADYVLGGETGLLLSAGMMQTPKTILFTLANKNQMVNYHRNDYSLQSKAPCSPCHVMAYSGSICETEKTYNAFPRCTVDFDLDELQGIIDVLYCKRF